MTMILVALAMIAIIAMAALSIDVTTLYLAREEPSDRPMQPPLPGHLRFRNHGPC